MECTSSFHTVEEFDNHVLDGQHTISEHTFITGDRIKLMYVKNEDWSLKFIFIIHIPSRTSCNTDNFYEGQNL